jgi:DNA-binding NarL/FixJ family response regulator
VNPRHFNTAQKARIEELARRYGMRTKEMATLVIDAGLSVMEHRLVENGNHRLPAISHQQGIVLGLLQQGKTVKEVAFQLQLGEATVRTHIKRLKDKLGCNDLLNLRMNPLPSPEAGE